MRPHPALIVPLFLLLACSQAADAPQPAKSASASSTASAARSSLATTSARPTAVASSSVSAPSNESSAPAPRLSAQQACDAVLKSGLGTICEALPLIAGSTETVQLTLPKPVGFTREIYAGFLIFATADALEKTRVEVTNSEVGAKRKPPIVITKGNAHLLVVVDGEISPADEARLRKVIDAL